MSNAECVKRYQQKQKKRLEDAERKLARAVQVLRDIDALLDDDPSYPSLGFELENRMAEVFNDDRP